MTIVKGVAGLADDAIALEFRLIERTMISSIAQRPYTISPIAMNEEVTIIDRIAPSRPSEAINNPCRLGTLKYIVCEAALAETPLDQVRLELDATKPGSSRNLSAYISDLRRENDLDVGHDGQAMWCKGYVVKR